MTEDRSERLSELRRVSRFSRFDEEHFKEMEEDCSRLPKWKLRLLDKAQKDIARQYYYKIKKLIENNAPFPVANVLREMAVEYTDRYASSGIETQPTHFSFFEPFLHVKLIENVAPYTELEKEHNQIFFLRDFLDYATSEMSNGFSMESLEKFPADEIYHFSTNGDINELTFANSDKREIIISGFSMIRRKSSIHWYLLAGELYNENDWLLDQDEQMDFSSVMYPNPIKEKLIKEAIAERGAYSGQRVSLEGSELAQRVIISGEYDFCDKKHLSRCMLVEFENSFYSHTDDLEVLYELSDEQRASVLSGAEKAFESVNSLWSLAESFFQLPAYFKKSIALNKGEAKKYKKRITKKKGGSGVVANYQIIPSLSHKSSSPTMAVEELFLPQYVIDKVGHWKYIGWDKTGNDRHGNVTSGKTWIPSKTKLQQNHAESTIFVKDTLASAKIKIREVLKRIENYPNLNKDRKAKGELYIMKCEAEEEHIFKVGFTTKTSEERATQLSSSTGVPKSFEVIRKWESSDARKLETDVHIILLPYRVDDSREFFKVELDVIIKAVERALDQS